MTNLGMKIVGGEMEVGFTAGSREEFDQHVAWLAMMAAAVWGLNPAAAKPSGAIGDADEARDPNAEYAREFANQAGGNFAEERKAAAAQAVAAEWRERQGLR